MKQITKLYINQTLKDKWWMSLVIANIAITLITVLVIAFSIEPKETQVFIHYSAFGVAGLYKGYWYFLWNYVFLAVIILFTHVTLSVKLRHTNKRDLSLTFLWATIAITILLLIFARAIIKIAALG